MFLFSEKELILKLRNPATRKGAFNVVVKQHQEKIYWYVRRMVVDYNDAKDVTQNTFIKAWESLDRFQFQSTLYTWLYRIATNESLNHIRKKYNRMKIPLEEAANYLTKMLDSGSYISGDEIYLKLEKAIALLPEKQRTVFILRYFEERSYEEIAAITDTSLGALHASYHHSVKKIEKILQDG